MAEIVRKEQKIFGESGGASEFGQFGSDAAGAPVTTKDIDVIQALSQYSQGWFGATPGQIPPRRQDRNALDLLFSTQIAYTLQKGIPEWLNSATQRYYAGKSIVTRSDGIYMAILGDDGANINAQKDPATEPLWWALIYQKPAVESWDATESVTYESAGVVVERYGKHFTSTGLTGNTNKDPINPANINYWYPSPGIDKLIDMFMAGEVVRGGMHKVNNLGDADYSTSLLLDKATFGGTTYEFYRVALDGSVVTGDATLEGILNTLSGTLYPHADIFAPDNLGTRTLVDMRGRGVTSMTTGGGEADIHGQVRDDQMQGHLHKLRGSGTEIPGAKYVGGMESNNDGPSDAMSYYGANGIVTDGTNGTPRTGATTHGADIVEGIKYIIVMKAA
jgi:hypothetical protein